MSALDEFARLKAENIDALGSDVELKRTTAAWFAAASKHRYSYHFNWFGIPVIQYPQDLVALQEIVWSSRPDCIIETGVAHGGSLLFYASLLKAMDIDGPVIGIDIDIRAHNRELIESHPLHSRIELIEGSSIAPETLAAVRSKMADASRTMVVLDSNHTYAHVAQELELYSQFLKAGDYLIVLDTIVDDMPADFSSDRPWGPGNGPKKAVREFLTRHPRFEVDHDYNKKLLISNAPDGFIRCTKDL